MPLSDSERSRRYRERKKAASTAKTRVVHTPGGDAVQVYTLTDIAKLIAAGDSTLVESAVRATIKAWVYKEAVPDSGVHTNIGAVRKFTDEQKDLLIKVYRRHQKKQMSILQIGNWLAARWSKICN